MTPASMRIEELKDGNKFERIVYHTFNYGLMALISGTTILIPLYVGYIVLFK